MAPAHPSHEGRPRPSLTNFAHYLSSNLAARRQCAAELAARYGAEYDPSTDFYRAWREAVVLGRRCGDDALRLRRTIAEQKDQRREVAYRLLTSTYLSWLGSRPRDYVPVTSAVWRSTHLDVSIAPLYGLRTRRGNVDVVLFYLRTAALSPDGVSAALYLLREHMSSVCDGGRPVLFDARRGVEYRNVGRVSQHYARQLDIEASGLAQLWKKVA